MFRFTKNHHQGAIALTSARRLSQLRTTSCNFS